MSNEGDSLIFEMFEEAGRMFHLAAIDRVMHYTEDCRLHQEIMHNKMHYSFIGNMAQWKCHIELMMESNLMSVTDNAADKRYCII